MVNPNEGGSILAEKVSRALHVRTDTVAMRAAFQALEGQSILDSRSVRTAMEHDALNHALGFQEALGKVVDSVRSMRETSSKIAQIASELRQVAETSAVSSATPEVTMLMQSGSHKNTDNLDDETKLAVALSTAFEGKEAARQRLEAVEAFLSEFHLSQEESQLLDRYNFEDLSDFFKFIDSLRSVRNIRQALHQQFVESETSSSALNILETLSQKQELAYERLYHWLQSELNEHNEEDDDEFQRNELVLSALSELRHVPAFCTHIYELLAGSRRSSVTRRFLLALTAGLDDGTPPMELKAHDSVACKSVTCFQNSSLSPILLSIYADVGDMLAFAFKSFSVEADLAQGLLSFQDDDNEDGEPSSSIAAETILSIAVSGLSRPLKSRILQVVATLARTDDADSDDEDDEFEEEGSLIRTKLTHLLDICGLLLFYIPTMEKTMSKLVKDGKEAEENNPLVESLQECLTEASKAFEASLRVYAAMLGQLTVATGESQAYLVKQLIEPLAEVRLSSPGFATDDSMHRCLSIEWITETLIEAAVCETLDDVVALQHCLAASKRAGMSVTAAEKLDESLEEKEKDLITALVEDETMQVLDLCGLGSVVEAWKSWNEAAAGSSGQMAMASYPGLSPSDVESGMKEFYASLYSPPLPSLESTIKDPVARKAARSKIAEAVSVMYGQLYGSITSSTSGYVDIGYLGHTPEQVETLFHV